MIIAIDGPSASGKGTLARRVAAHFGLDYLDSGKLYRAVGLAVLAKGGALDDEAAATDAARAIDVSSLDRAELTSDEAGKAASIVAAIPSVRQALLEFQKGFAAKPGGAVLDGRDMGTVICPTADHKLFVTASTEERARRRFAELVQRGDAPVFETVLEDMKARDARDSERTVSPLKPADDAVVIDTDGMDADAVFAAALAIIDRTD